MWRKIYKELERFQATLTVQEYCVSFMNLINADNNLWEIEHLEKILIQPAEDQLFPEILNLHNHFNNGNYKFIVNFIYHFPHINKDWYDFNGTFSNMDSNKIYERIFNESCEEFILAKSIFLPEYLLSMDEEERILSFLFLFFLPVFKNHELLYHYKNKIPLLCCSGITNNNFDMLLFLMKEYDSFGMQMLSCNRNLNHILIEEFMNNATELYSFDENIDWNVVLPTYKLKKLIDLDHSFSNFETTMSDKFRVIFDKLPNILKEIEVLYIKTKLDCELKTTNHISFSKLKI